MIERPSHFLGDEAPDGFVGVREGLCGADDAEVVDKVGTALDDLELR